ncbi:hypothetical protein F4680DRAFT_316404 [Xylaria scruposa]|nr:hypothetical protein F4680DRAFT_316404 [Xylaria scruposa]
MASDGGRKIDGPSTVLQKITRRGGHAVCGIRLNSGGETSAIPLATDTLGVVGLVIFYPFLCVHQILSHLTLVFIASWLGMISEYHENSNTLATKIHDKLFRTTRSCSLVILGLNIQKEREANQKLKDAWRMRFCIMREPDCLKQQSWINDARAWLYQAQDLSCLTSMS